MSAPGGQGQPERPSAPDGNRRHLRALPRHYLHGAAQRPKPPSVVSTYPSNLRRRALAAWKRAKLESDRSTRRRIAASFFRRGGAQCRGVVDLHGTRLGHDHAPTAYGHLLPGAQEEATIRLDAYFDARGAQSVSVEWPRSGEPSNASCPFCSLSARAVAPQPRLKGGGSRGTVSGFPRRHSRALGRRRLRKSSARGGPPSR
jgi:hypothetical protein